VAGGSYPPAQAQEISFMPLRRVTEHVRCRNWTAVGIGFLIILVGLVSSYGYVMPGAGG
jgi:hypothetical protein